MYLVRLHGFEHRRPPRACASTGNSDMLRAGPLRRRNKAASRVGRSKNAVCSDGSQTGLAAGRTSDHQCNKDGQAPMEMRRAWLPVLGPDPHTSASPAGVSQSASPVRHESASALRSDDRHCECFACFATAISTCIPVGMMVAPMALYESRPIDRCVRTHNTYGTGTRAYTSCDAHAHLIPSYSGRGCLAAAACQPGQDSQSVSVRWVPARLEAQHTS